MNLYQVQRINYFENLLTSSLTNTEVDELGRIVIPIELRRTLEINSGEPLEIFVDKDMIILRKYQPFCVFCGNTVNFNLKLGHLLV